MLEKHAGDNNTKNDTERDKLINFIKYFRHNEGIKKRNINFIWLTLAQSIEWDVLELR